MAATDGREKWIEAALQEIAKGGIERVRVEILAASLGVTKGGFYRRFKDRRALLDAMLETWSRGRTAAIEKQTELAGAKPGERLKSLIKLYSERVNPEGMAIELAMRQWARTDAAAAAAVASVDTARLRNVAQIYAKSGLSQDAANARAFLFYSFIFGQSLLFVGRDAAKQRRLLDQCARVLAEI